jgi:hypothetical protein
MGSKADISIETQTPRLKKLLFISMSQTIAKRLKKLHIQTKGKAWGLMTLDRDKNNVGGNRSNVDAIFGGSKCISDDNIRNDCGYRAYNSGALIIPESDGF